MGETIPGVLREAAARFGGKVALVAPGMAPLDFAGLDAMTDRFARALIADGLEPAGRVAVCGPNSAEWIAAAIGAQRAGGVVIPLYFRLSAGEIAEILRRARASVLVCTAELAAQLQGQAPPLPGRTVLFPGSTGQSSAGWNEYCARGQAVDDAALHGREAGVTGECVSDIMFTSGTTGRPKGAVFSHASSVRAARIMQHYNGAGEADCFCPMGSFAHVGGYKQGWLTGLVSGARVCWGDALDPPSALGLIQDFGVTIMPAAPITWQGILDYPERGAYDIASLRFAATGATVIPPELVRRLIAETGVRQVGTGYGMTESCGLAAYTLPDHPVEKLVATVGTAAPDTEIRIVDAAGRELGTGEPGEILIRNPRLLIEYLDDPAATAAALTATAGFIPATSAASTPTDSSASPTGSRTCTSSTVSTCIRPRSNA